MTCRFCQLGFNPLATAITLRIAHRLPFRQVTQMFANLPELSVSPGAISHQVQRVADWFDGDFEKLMIGKTRDSHECHSLKR